MDLTLRHVHVVGSHDVKSDMREETPKSSKSSVSSHSPTPNV